ncbi:MAG TPA: glycosyltransferase family 2 protein [Gemmatimonadaceae bacterium]|nr:glycosyltransferase family 2 protein [Gemmatimonadaceae bacterium]
MDDATRLSGSLPDTGDSFATADHESRVASHPRITPVDVERTEPAPYAAGPWVDVSVLVPAKDEAENLPLFMDLVARAFEGSSTRYEVIVIDDGSVDDTWQVLEGLRARYAFLRTVRHRARRGIADALRTGYLHARGSILVFYPADLQFKPEDIPRLVAPILAGDSDMVTGFKEGRYEKAFVSGVYNRLSRALFGINVKDLNSVKAYRREVMEHIPVRPDWHRYMIVLAHAQGFSVSEIPVPLYPRHAGRSKFGVSRIPVGVLDMLSVWFELRFAQKPLLFFGMMGAALFAIGVIAGVVAVVRLALFGVGTRAAWTVIQTCLLLGSIFFATGFLGEQVAGQRAQLRELRRRLDEIRSGQER